MATTSYQVYGELRMRVGNAQSVIQRLADSVGGLAARLRGAESVGGRLFRGLMAFGAGYLGFQALTGWVRRAGSSMVEFYDQTEQARIRIGALSANIEGIAFDDATRRADGFIDRLRELALQSPATGQDLINIFSDISGPIAHATGSMEDALETSQRLANAAGVLGLGQDFAQASRDFRAMIEGRAGVDVRTFSALRSVGAISQTTEAWNQMALADPQEAYRQLNEILGRFNIAAQAQGNSLAGLTSSLRSVVSEIGGAFSGPVMERFKAFLRTVVGRLLANFDALKGGARALGERIAGSLEGVFTWIIGRMDWLAAHWDEVSQRFHGIVENLRRAAQVFAALSGARMLGGMALGGIGSLIGGGATAASAAGGIAQLAQLLGGGAAAAGGTAAAGAAGSATIGGALAAVMAAITAPMLLGAIAALTVALGAVAAFAVAGAAVFLEMEQHGVAWVSFFNGELGPAWAELSAAFSLLWLELQPLVALLGRGILIALVIGIRWAAHRLTEAVMMANIALRAVIGPVGAFVAALNGMSDTANAELGGIVMALEGFFRAMAGTGLIPFAQAAADGMGTVWRRYFDPSRVAEDAIGLDEAATADAATSAVPSADDLAHRGTTVNVHHMEIRQEFREADPDRVLVRILREIDGQADRALSSEFAPILSR